MAKRFTGKLAEMSMIHHRTGNLSIEVQSQQHCLRCHSLCFPLVVSALCLCFAQNTTDVILNASQTETIIANFNKKISAQSPLFVLL